MIIRVMPELDNPALGRALSRGEIRELHRGERTPAEIAAWLACARGLKAPRAPADGELRPNDTGWLVSVDPAAPGLHPRWPLALAGGAGAGALVVQWSEFFVSQRPSWIVGILMGALLVLLVIAVRALAARRTLRREFARAARTERLADAAPGELVCVTGVIAAQPTVPSLFRGTPAVLFRDCVGGADEIRGIDFDLRVDDGPPVRVCVRRAWLIDRPTRVSQPPACGPVYAAPDGEGFRPHLRSALLDQPSPLSWSWGAHHECAVGPGDRVEVAGVLHHELAPDAVDPFARLIPTRLVLRAGQAPLLVRRLDASLAPAP